MRCRLLSWVLFVSLSLTACGDDKTTIPYRVEVVAADGSALNLEGHTVRIEVKESDGETLSAESTSGIDFSFPISSASQDTRVRVLISGNEPLHGAPPIFSPASSGGFLRIAVAPPSSCQTVPVDRPSTGDPTALTRVGTFVIGVGGRASGDQSGRVVDAFDLLRFAVVTIPPIELAGSGPIVTTSVGRSKLIAVSDEGAVLYDAADSETPSRAITLHAGAGSQSSLLTLGSGSALVIGPPRDGEQTGMSLVAPDASIAMGVLPPGGDVARLFVVESGPSALIVAPNSGETNSVSVWRVDINRAEASLLTDALAIPIEVQGVAPLSNGAWLVAADGTSALLRCADECSIEAGPRLPSNVVAVRHTPGSDNSYAIGDFVIALTRNVSGANDPGAFAVVAATDATVSDSVVVTAFDGGATMLFDESHIEYCVPSALAPL